MSKRIEVNGTKYLNKNEALDTIQQLSKGRTPITSVEVVSIQDNEVHTSMNKTLWFNTQRGVYKSARLFVMRQMVGEWNWVEIKTG